MSKQNPVRRKEGDDKKSKKPFGRLSEHKPRADDVARALKAKKPSQADVNKMLSLNIEEAFQKDKPIILSDDWYEFSVFVRKFNICKGTVNNWLQNGWLAYSEIGKMRFINKADIEEMMLRFRRPSIWYSLLFMVLGNTDLLII